MKRFARVALFVSLLALSLAACKQPPPEHVAPVEASARIGYGTVMAEVARRFELLGRAGTAGRFELAEYQLDEIGEAFEDSLPHASPPKEGHPEVLPSMASAFEKNQLPDMKRALASHDKMQIVAAFERVAVACNGCHQASGHAFIEVPRAPGKSIPSTEPLVP